MPKCTESEGLNLKFEARSVSLWPSDFPTVPCSPRHKPFPPPLEKCPSHGHLLRTPLLSPVWAHFIPACTVYAHVFACVHEQSGFKLRKFKTFKLRKFALPHKVTRKTMSPLSRKPTTVAIRADTQTDFLSLSLPPTLML